MKRPALAAALPFTFGDGLRIVLRTTYGPVVRLHERLVGLPALPSGDGPLPPLYDWNPVVDLAGDRAFAAAGMTLIQHAIGSAAALEVPVLRGCSLGLTAGIGAPQSPQGGAGTHDTALRVTYRWMEEDGWVVGAAMSAELRNATWGGSLGRSRLSAIPQFVCAYRLPPIEGLDATFRGAAGWRFWPDPTLGLLEELTPPMTAELAIAVRPGSELVLGGGSLLGYRAIW